MGTQVLNIAKVFGAKWWIVYSFLWLVSCTSEQKEVPYYNSPDLTPTWCMSSSVSDEHQIADFEFTNQEGKQFGSRNLEGKYYVANFFFTSRPSICPRMTENLKTVANHFSGDADVQLVSFSVTPNIDSVQRLKTYHSGKGLSDRWNLLTGSQAKIYDLSRRSFFVEEEIGFSKDSSDFLHTERCVLVDRDQHIRGVYNATVALDMERLIADIEWLKKEETDG